MAKQKLGQEPAMPCITKESKRLPYERSAETVDVYNSGMSKRLLIAKDVLCALLTNKGAYWQGGKESENLDGYLPGEAAQLSLRFADELLKQEGE